MNLNRVFTLAALLLTVTTVAVSAENESLASIFTNATPGRPHVLPRRTSVMVLAFRGLGRGDLSCYGQTNFQTPNLDRLAGEGMRFSDYRAAGDDLATAQSVLMAGDPAGLAAGLPTLAQRLRQAGYATGLIGEWALGSQTWTQGLDDFAGYFNDQETADYYPAFLWRTAPLSLHDRTNGMAPKIIRERLYANEGGKHEYYMPDAYLDLAASFVRIHLPDKANHYQPFFLLVSLPMPHSITPGKDVYPVPTDAPYSSEAWPQAAKNRAALIMHLDTAVGRLFASLQRLPLTNNLAVFITGATAPEKFADTNLDFLTLPGEVRGGSSPERFRAPMIVRWPKHVPADSVNPTPWSAADFAATALDIAYAKPEHLAGTSLLPVLLGKTNWLAVPHQ